MAEKILNRIDIARWLIAACCLAFAVQPANAEDPAPIDELRKSFTVSGNPVPPGIFRDMGDGDLADSDSIIVTIDVKAATGSNLYADPIRTKGTWVSQTKQDPSDKDLTEEEAYRFIGVTANELLVVITSYSGGGSGAFYTLHILVAEPARAFDSDGKPYERLNLTTIRRFPLGDRWDGSVKIDGNRIVITTTGSIPEGHNRKPSTTTIDAARP